MARLPHAVCERKKKSKIMGKPGTINHQDLVSGIYIRHTEKETI